MGSRGRLCVAVSALMFVLTGGVAQAAFEAHGSARQVYATGLDGHAKATLVNRKGRKVASKKADSLGAVLFRNVKPGSRYRVRLAKGVKSGPITVLSNRPAPPSTDIYNQVIPSHGYGY